MRRWIWIVVAVPWVTVQVAAAQEPTGLVLPMELQWCEPLDSVASKLGIADTSEFGHAYRADGDYLVTGVMWEHKGNYTVRFEQYGDTWYLIEVDFRMFRLDEAWADMQARLAAMLGPGTSEVMASAVHGPDGEELIAQRVRAAYKDPEGNWDVLSRQMSNEIDSVKFSYEAELCKPEGWTPGQVQYDVEAPAKSEGRGDDVFEYDMWADDPLHEDTRAQEIEEERKKKEEEQKKEEEEQVEGEIDWDGDDNEAVEW